MICMEKFSVWEKVIIDKSHVVMQNILKRDAFCHYIITKAAVVLTLHIAFNINKLNRNFVLEFYK